MDQEKLQSPLEHFERTCREAGLKLTFQRQEIYRELMDSCDLLLKNPSLAIKLSSALGLIFEIILLIMEVKLGKMKLKYVTSPI